MCTTKEFFKKMSKPFYGPFEKIKCRFDSISKYWIRST